MNFLLTLPDKFVLSLCLGVSLSKAIILQHFTNISDYNTNIREDVSSFGVLFTHIQQEVAMHKKKTYEL